MNMNHAVLVSFIYDITIITAVIVIENKCDTFGIDIY